MGTQGGPFLILKTWNKETTPSHKTSSNIIHYPAPSGQNTTKVLLCFVVV